MATDCIVAKYRIETALELERVADVIAGEQSCGTFLPVPRETAELKVRARARVLGIHELEWVSAPSLLGGRTREAGRYRRAEVTIAFPLANVGINLVTLLATVCGNLYELAEHTGCKLLALELPEAFAARCRDGW